MEKLQEQNVFLKDSDEKSRNSFAMLVTQYMWKMLLWLDEVKGGLFDNQWQKKLNCMSP